MKEPHFTTEVKERNNIVSWTKASKWINVKRNKHVLTNCKVTFQNQNLMEHLITRWVLHQNMSASSLTQTITANVHWIWRTFTQILKRRAVLSNLNPEMNTQQTCSEQAWDGFEVYHGLRVLWWHGFKRDPFLYKKSQNYIFIITYNYIWRVWFQHAISQ